MYELGWLRSLLLLHSTAFLFGNKLFWQMVIPEGGWRHNFLVLSFFPLKDKLCSFFYPKNCIFTFVVEKKVWKLEMLSILIEFPTFCGGLSIPNYMALPIVAHTHKGKAQIRAEQRLPGWRRALGKALACTLGKASWADERFIWQEHC